VLKLQRASAIRRTERDEPLIYCPSGARHRSSELRDGLHWKQLRGEPFSFEQSKAAPRSSPSLSNLNSSDKGQRPGRLKGRLVLGQFGDFLRMAHIIRTDKCAKELPGRSIGDGSLGGEQ
jgi:hypothetical protein